MHPFRVAILIFVVGASIANVFAAKLIMVAVLAWFV